MGSDSRYFHREHRKGVFLSRFRSLTETKRNASVGSTHVGESISQCIMLTRSRTSVPNISSALLGPRKLIQNDALSGITAISMQG